MSRVCIFCKRTGQRLTLEHVYPDWLSKLFDQKLEGINEVSGDNTNRIWKSTAFQHKVKLVCGDCNNGWMSALEGNVKDLLTGIAFTREGCILGKDDQHKLSLWVQKTVLVINKAVGGEFNIPSSFYEQLYANYEQPTANMMVSVGWRLQASGSKEYPLATFEIKQVSNIGVEKNSVNAINEQVQEGAMVWAASIALGYAVFQVVGTDLKGELEVGSSDHRIFATINPYVKSLQWPVEWPIEAVGGLQAVRSAMYGDTI